MTIPVRKFGSTGFQVPVLGQGTWEMEHDDRAEALAALRHGLDLGMVHIDTAEMYGNGRVEELVGEAIRGRRDEVFLVSKVLPSNASRSGTVQACERSLQRLGTDRLDCYLLHWAGAHPLADTIAAFEQLVAAGKIRSYGVSNFDEQEVAEAVALAGQGGIACNQVLYHLDERAVEHAVIPFCAEQDIPVVAYSPFGSGEFPGPRTSRGKVLGEVAKKYRATPHQVALAFLLRHRSVLAIPKASRSGHVTENAGAAALDLGPEDLDRVHQAFPLGPRRPGVPTI
jgi:diketogulonate reductase-like aldo/keto reductase